MNKRYFYDMAVEQDDPERPYGAETARIIDSIDDGPVAYCHESRADFLVDTLNAGSVE